MWRNYWTVAVRALAKSRTYSIINIAGLAIGMAACVLILLYVRYERELRQLASQCAKYLPAPGLVSAPAEAASRSSCRCPPMFRRARSRRTILRSSAPVTR